MSVSSIKGKEFHTCLGPYPSKSFNLRIYLTTEEINRPFLFDSGSVSNYLTMDTFTELCKKSKLPVKMEKQQTHTATLADGRRIEIPGVEIMIYVKFEDEYYLSIPFLVNDRIHKNIIGIKNIPEYMYWVIGGKELVDGSKEFYILRRN